jgi:hypothetical protein
MGSGKGTQTDKNLLAVFAGESQVRVVPDAISIAEKQHEK